MRKSKVYYVLTRLLDQVLLSTLNGDYTISPFDICFDGREQKSIPKNSQVRIQSLTSMLTGMHEHIGTIDAHCTISDMQIRKKHFNAEMQKQSSFGKEGCKRGY